MTRRLLALWIGLVPLAAPVLADAYELRTHGEITRHAYEMSDGLRVYLEAAGISAAQTFAPNDATPRSQLARFENSGTALDWMIEGAIREDDYIDHFLGRVFGCPRPQNPPSQADRVFNHFLDVQRSGRGLTIPIGNLGLPAPDWALGRQGRGSGPGQNQFSVLDARDYQYQSLTASSRAMRDKYTALLFRSLGHVLHLVEDMAQPQHTRNDPHAGCADIDPMNVIVGAHSWYEEYTENRTLGRTFPRIEDVAPGLVLGGYDPVPVRPYDDFFTEANRRGIADFSSRNFLSAGTNLGGSSERCGGLVEPPCEASAYRQAVQPFSTKTLNGTISGVVTLYLRDVVDALTGQVLGGRPVTSKSVWDQYLLAVGGDPKFSLNRFNYDAMADILLPRAVGYAAGFLNAFFRGFVGVTYEDQSLRVVVGSDEPMVGDFRLLYERSDGTRAELAAWAALRVGPNEPSQLLPTPQLPGDAVPDAPCFLIFRGQLGLESGAVAGAQVACPPVPPPPPPPAGQWYVYYCATFIASDNYFYATMNPPLWDFDAALLFYYKQESTGTGFSCSLKTRGWAEQPPGTRTDHPA